MIEAIVGFLTNGGEEMFSFDWHVVMIALIFMVVDYLTGFLKAAMQHEIKSSKMREGLYHKGGFVLVIVLAILIEYAMYFIPELGFTIPLVIAVCTYIIITEVVSILENLGCMNPALLSSKLLSYFNVSDKPEDKTEKKPEED